MKELLFGLLLLVFSNAGIAKESVPVKLEPIVKTAAVPTSNCGCPVVAPKKHVRVKKQNAPFKKPAAVKAKKKPQKTKLVKQKEKAVVASIVTPQVGTECNTNDGRIGVFRMRADESVFCEYEVKIVDQGAVLPPPPVVHVEPLPPARERVVAQQDDGFFESRRFVPVALPQPQQQETKPVVGGGVAHWGTVAVTTAAILLGINHLKKSRPSSIATTSGATPITQSITQGAPVSPALGGPGNPAP